MSNDKFYLLFRSEWDDDKLARKSEWLADHEWAFVDENPDTAGKEVVFVVSANLWQELTTQWATSTTTHNLV